MREIDVRRLLREAGLDLRAESLDDALNALEFVLTSVLPYDKSADRMAKRRVLAWLRSKAGCQGFEHREVIPIIADFAFEAASPEAKNPQAVFLSLLKKELGYDGRGGSQRR